MMYMDGAEDNPSVYDYTLKNYTFQKYSVLKLEKKKELACA